MSFEFKLKRALAGMSHPAALWNPVWMAPANSIDIDALLETKVRTEDLYEEAIQLWETSESTNDVDRTLEFFTNFYLQDDILAKVDRAAMMVSLETRAVFLDNDLVAFCQRLPHRFKFWRGTRKYILRKAMARFLPASTLMRRKKGFGIPLARWLMTLDPAVRTGVAGISSTTANRWWKEQRNGQADRRVALWTWLSFQHCISGRAAGLQGAH
jgi:asparagine synthase (glutamine-hydrolysing)